MVFRKQGDHQPKPAATPRRPSARAPAAAARNAEPKRPSLAILGGTTCLRLAGAEANKRNVLQYKKNLLNPAEHVCRNQVTFSMHRRRVSILMLSDMYIKNLALHMTHIRGHELLLLSLSMSQDSSFSWCEHSSVLRERKLKYLLSSSFKLVFVCIFGSCSSFALS